MTAYDYDQVVDEHGVSCPQCHTMAFPIKIEIGPRIGQRFTFKCLQGHKFQAQKGAS